MTRRLEGWTAAVLFVGSIWLANYLIRRVGTVCPPGGPCLVPVWPGVMAPSGVLAIGLSFTLRDLVQRRLGRGAAVAAIVAGAALSATLSPQLALASGTAFLLSETMDLLVYTPLQARNLVMATAASNVVGLVIDSAVFLFLAFGSLQFIGGQIIGKAWMTAAALPAVAYLRRREATDSLS
ncbi:MAG: VUT family protein [Armatimonadota bacterium]|nr:VUT family protein [Armatimonadota bacterium]MDR7532037.1 VUT family protein [Armatimonadota bacterium]MDR7535968.1 VUT family protein [Armatimonadota bacterium]